jgi:hypothetical protein
MATRLLCVFSLMGILLVSACTRHEIQVAPVEVKPIHITVDVNVRVDRALDDFFGDLDEKDRGETGSERSSEQK